MGKWGSGEFQIKPQHPNTPTPQHPKTPTPNTQHPTPNETNPSIQKNAPILVTGDARENPFDCGYCWDCFC
ncbi:MAG: hypothetical protein EWV53_09255 [Microcystis panniformis Mp_MB_F_20051200_S9]|uniref:Uncharacterized protein n=1 Tax=Microcystis panniformis Mp_MB_F_20051200_S9 TaxID=2486223 RepID=A0A552Q183_9CHRO|nr:MAG: hypothetical protein EWV43_19430 [Microcystis panniformis Mp_MB_F_20080800_S26D]TRV48663.1 MAG: hypothetical protein EWV87_11760 [Microcystis panniformis Mp_GB_SS_20050300_S99]TRV54691.1 MAG: hypothetical protein EWV42_03325 [Microcystis panniformis Mp_GB_SS_20050300_S99D]TRV60828.1 MAG: hypothetical protein EWV86_15640 [Microcystis panniformis Mp_MB_F_20051200_S9D]TRV61994.1 MAG: hypothetical protein EWV69_06410 [Microcystis panniformis Mp_MB_F_20080800_S26]TRV62975.1 MAG: hypothetica